MSSGMERAENIKNLCEGISNRWNIMSSRERNNYAKTIYAAYNQISDPKFKEMAWRYISNHQRLLEYVINHIPTHKRSGG